MLRDWSRAPLLRTSCLLQTVKDDLRGIQRRIKESIERRRGRGTGKRRRRDRVRGGQEARQQGSLDSASVPSPFFIVPPVRPTLEVRGWPPCTFGLGRVSGFTEEADVVNYHHLPQSLSGFMPLDLIASTWKPTMRVRSYVNRY